MSILINAALVEEGGEVETHRLRCGKIVPALSVGPNCGIRVELRLDLRAKSFYQALLKNNAPND